MTKERLISQIRITIHPYFMVLYVSEYTDLHISLVVIEVVVPMPSPSSLHKIARYKTPLMHIWYSKEIVVEQYAEEIRTMKTGNIPLGPVPISTWRRHDWMAIP